MPIGRILEVHLTPTFIEVRSKGRIARAPIPASAWEGAWSKGLTGLDPLLARALQEVGVDRGNADIFYTSPDAAAELMTLPLGVEEAREAALLRIRESLSESGPTTPTLAIVLEQGVDSNGKPRAHVLAAADRSETIEAVAGFLRRARLRPRLIIPRKAYLMRWAVEAAKAAPKDKQTAILRLDSHAGVLTGGLGGQLSFGRLLDTGVHMLAEAYARAMRTMCESSPDLATTLLHSHGIPRRDTMIDHERGVRGEAVLPMLQPALQRLAIEIKQTLRFALAESQSARVQVRLASTGRPIPGLAAAISGLLDTEVIDETIPERRPEAELSLTPFSEIAIGTRQSFAAALRVGAVASLAVIASDYVLTSRVAERLGREVAGTSVHAAQFERATSQKARLDQVRQELGRLDAFIDGVVEHHASSAASLAMLTRLDIPGLRIHEVLTLHTADDDVMTIRGSLPMLKDGGDPLPPLLAELGASPLVSSVHLTSSRSSLVGDDEGIHFSLTLTLRPIVPGDLARMGDKS